MGNQHLLLRNFSTNVFRGEIAFMGRENVKNVQKTNKNLLVFGGGEIFPPKGPEKKTKTLLLLLCMQLRKGRVIMCMDSIRKGK